MTVGKEVVSRHVLHETFVGYKNYHIRNMAVRTVLGRSLHAQKTWHSTLFFLAPHPISRQFPVDTKETPQQVFNPLIVDQIFRVERPVLAFLGLRTQTKPRKIGWLAVFKGFFRVCRKLMRSGMWGLRKSIDMAFDIWRRGDLQNEFWFQFSMAF